MPGQGGADWSKQQTVAFTGWANARLAVAGLKISDLFEDLGDGVILPKLLEVSTSPPTQLLTTQDRLWRKSPLAS